MKRAKVAVVVALAVALGAAACSSPASKNTGSGGGNTKIQTAAKIEDPTAKGPAPEVPGAKHGGTITVTSESTPSTFDPTRVYYTDSDEIGRLLFRTPTQYAVIGGKPELVPDLTDLGTPSADKLTWTFKLQPNIKYADGTPISVNDIKYAIERSFARDLYPDGPTYQLQYFKDGDKYKGPYKDTTPYDGVDTPDANTLVIHLSQQFPDLPFFMTFPMFTPIPQAKDTKAQYGNMPMATGPYQFDHFTPGSELTLKKNPYWDPNTDPVGHQYPDAWDFKWGGTDLKSQQAILQGSNATDTTSINYGNLDASLIPQIQSGPKAVQLVQGDSPCTIVRQLDSRKIPLPVRKAIATAYPYDQTYKAAGLNPYVAQPASTILPPSVPGYQAYTPLPGLSGQGQGDPAAAKQMLQAANQVGFTLSYYYNNTDPETEQSNTILTQAMTAAGFKVKAIGVSPAELRTKTADYSAPVNMGQSPAGWCSDWPDGASWFPVLFETSSLKSGLSWGEMSDPAIDSQINQIAALGPVASAPKWAAVDKQLMGMYLVIPRYYNKFANVQGTGLGKTVVDPTEGMPFFDNMYVK